MQRELASSGRVTKQAPRMQFQHSVVVVGSMNPAIHHPAWYGLVGILPEAEWRPAAVNVLVLPQLAQFSTASIQIQCAPDRWSVTDLQPRRPDRILDIAALTFDRLNDTPIGSFGLNTTTSVDVSPSALAGLSRALCHGPFYAPLNGTEPDLERVTMGYTLPPLPLPNGKWLNRRLHTTIAIRTAPSGALVVSTNAHHQIVQTEFGHFALRPMLEASWSVFEAAELQIERLVDQLLHGGR